MAGLVYLCLSTVCMCVCLCVGVCTGMCVSVQQYEEYKIYPGLRCADQSELDKRLDKPDH